MKRKHLGAMLALFCAVGPATAAPTLVGCSTSEGSFLVDVPDGAKANVADATQTSDSATRSQDAAISCVPQSLTQISAALYTPLQNVTDDGTLLLISNDKYWTAKYQGVQSSPSTSQTQSWAMTRDTDYGYLKDNSFWQVAPLNPNCNCRPWEGAGVTGIFASGSKSSVTLVNKNLWWKYDYTAKTWTTGSLADLWGPSGTLPMPVGVGPDGGTARRVYDGPGVTAIAVNNLGLVYDFSIPVSQIVVVSEDLLWNLNWTTLADGGVTDEGTWSQSYLATTSVATPAQTVINGQAKPWEGPGITAGFPSTTANLFSVVSADKRWTIYSFKSVSETSAGLVKDDAFLKTAPVITCP